jgi:hypothetical protein
VSRTRQACTGVPGQFCTSGNHQRSWCGGNIGRNSLRPGCFNCRRLRISVHLLCPSDCLRNLSLITIDDSPNSRLSWALVWSSGTINPELLPRDLRVCNYVVSVSIQKGTVSAVLFYWWASLRDSIGPISESPLVLNPLTIKL